MKSSRLSFIGAGNMARSLIGGLIADGWDPASIAVSDPDTQQLSSLATHFQIHTETSNQVVTADCDVVVLAVAHQQFRNLGADGIKAYGKDGAVIYDIKYLLPPEASSGRL